MSGLSPYGEAQVLAAVTDTAFVSLHVGDPGSTGANEVTGVPYARQGPIDFANSGSDPTVAANASIIQYPTATSTWGNIGWFGLWDSAVNGNFLGSDALASTKNTGAGDIVRFLAGELTVTAQ
jgi:hypothetical protein